MIRPTRVHLTLLNQRVVPLVELKELLALFAPAYVDLPIQSALEDRGEIPERVLHVLDIDDP